MAKQIVKTVKRRKREIVVSEGVRIVMAGLSPKDKTAVEASFQTVSALLRLPIEAVVRAPNGDLRTAKVTDELRLIYRVGSERVEVTDLLSAGAVRYLIDPAWLHHTDAKTSKKKNRVLYHTTKIASNHAN